MELSTKSDDLLIGVVGGGAMGQGIVQVSLEGGMKVVLFDAKTGGGNEAKDAIFGRLERNVEKGRLEKNVLENIKQNLVLATDLSEFKKCDVVIEAVFEDIDVKLEVFKEVEKWVAPNCVIASNTSSLPIASLGRYCKHQNRFAGLHFFNPVPLMRLVEVIKGPSTEDWVIEGLTNLGKRMGRTPVVVRDAPGF